MDDPLLQAAVQRKVGVAALRRIHQLIASEAEERRRIWIFTRAGGIVALLLVLLVGLAFFGARL